MFFFPPFSSWAGSAHFSLPLSLLPAAHRPPRARAADRRARPPLSLTGGAHLSSPSSRRVRRRARALAPPPPRIAPHPAVPARIKERGITPRDSLSRFPVFPSLSPSDSSDFLPAFVAGASMAAEISAA